MSMQNFFKHLGTRFWSKEEQLALTKVVYEIYHSDDEFSVEEEKHFVALLKRFSLDLDQLENLTAQDAVQTLLADENKKQTAYVLLVEAIFKDEDFDEQEQQFIKKLAKTSDLADPEFQAEIKNMQYKKLDKIVKRWQWD